MPIATETWILQMYGSDMLANLHDPYIQRGYRPFVIVMLTFSRSFTSESPIHWVNVAIDSLCRCLQRQMLYYSQGYWCCGLTISTGFFSSSTSKVHPYLMSCEVDINSQLYYTKKAYNICRYNTLVVCTRLLFLVCLCHM